MRHTQTGPHSIICVPFDCNEFYVIVKTYGECLQSVVSETSAKDHLDWSLQQALIYSLFCWATVLDLW